MSQKVLLSFNNNEMHEYNVRGYIRGIGLKHKRMFFDGGNYIELFLESAVDNEKYELLKKYINDKGYNVNLRTLAPAKKETKKRGKKK